MDHTVEEGDHILRVARVSLSPDPDALWSANPELSASPTRPHGGCLIPGETITLPGAGQPVNLTLNQVATFTVTRVKAQIRVQLQDHLGAPLDDEPYTLTWTSSGEEAQGSLSGGVLTEPLPDPELVGPGVAVAQVSFEGGAELTLRVGAMQPVSETAGAQSRLRNLGHYVGPLDGEASEFLRAAVARFQRSVAVPVTGELDEATQLALLEAHGG